MSKAHQRNRDSRSASLERRSKYVGSIARPWTQVCLTAGLSSSRCATPDELDGARTCLSTIHALPSTNPRKAFRSTAMLRSRPCMIRSICDERRRPLVELSDEGVRRLDAPGLDLVGEVATDTGSDPQGQPPAAPADFEAYSLAPHGDRLKGGQRSPSLADASRALGVPTWRCPLPAVVRNTRTPSERPLEISTWGFATAAAAPARRQVARASPGALACGKHGWTTRSRAQLALSRGRQWYASRSRMATSDSPVRVPMARFGPRRFAGRSAWPAAGISWRRGTGKALRPAGGQYRQNPMPGGG